MRQISQQTLDHYLGVTPKDRKEEQPTHSGISVADLEGLRVVGAGLAHHLTFIPSTQKQCSLVPEKEQPGNKAIWVGNQHIQSIRPRKHTKKALK